MSDFSRVQCIVAGAEVGARQCVDTQQEHRCFCPKAPLAIGAVKPSAIVGSRLDHALATLCATARAMILKPAEQRYLGPAETAYRTGKPVGLSLAAADPVPVARLQSIQNTTPPAVPAKESSMAAGKKGAAFTATDEEVRRAFEESGGSINKTMAKLGTTSWVAVKKRVAVLGLQGKPTKPAVATKASRKLWKKQFVDGSTRQAPPVAPPADVISLLERQLAHHQEQAEKCERALAVLR